MISDESIPDLIITDLKRGTDIEAGLKFVQELYTRQLAVPILVYAGRGGVRRYASSLTKLGVKCVTTDMVTLIKAVQEELS